MPVKTLPLLLTMATLTVSGVFSALGDAEVVLAGVGASDGFAEGDAEGVAGLVGDGDALADVVGVVETVGVLGVQATAAIDRLATIARFLSNDFCMNLCSCI
jgi:hypothetical protein